MTSSIPDFSVRQVTDGDIPELVEVLGEQQPSSAYPLRWPLPFPVEKFLVRDTEEAAWVAEQAIAVYRHRGWTVVGETRPEWLPADLEPVLLMALVR